jgi:hypothetical protein
MGVLMSFVGFSPYLPDDKAIRPFSKLRNDSELNCGAQRRQQLGGYAAHLPTHDFVKTWLPPKLPMPGNANADPKRNPTVSDYGALAHDESLSRGGATVNRLQQLPGAITGSQGPVPDSRDGCQPGA